MSEASHYRDRAAGRVHEDEEGPQRPDMDGGRTDDIAMLSTPVWLEHGEPDSTLPAMGMYLTVRPDWKLLFDEPYDWCRSSSPRDHLYQDVDEFLQAHYGKTGEGYGISIEAKDIDWRSDGPGTRTATAEVYIEVEFWAEDGYRGAESLDEWTDRVISNTQFWDVYNHFVMFFTGQERLEEQLRNVRPNQKQFERQVQDHARRTDERTA